MSFSLSNPGPFQPQQQEFRFTKIDLAVFAVFFGLTVVFMPLALLGAMRVFTPDLTAADLTGVQLVLMQVAMNVVLIAFIFFLVKVVHGQAFLGTIKWSRNHRYQTGFLIALGASLALSVMLMSSLFPPSEPPPIEQLITSSNALYMFVFLGVGVAPIVEEIIFRGFLFRVLEDISGPAVAIPSTAILFTLLHIPQLWGSWAGIALIFVVGYALSYIRDRSNSLIPPFIVHTAYNAMLFTVYALGTFAQQNLRP